ncbi:MAG: TIGR02530 family flagellar biosynthesis protein [Candidatus Eisenbacteria bacterium]
MTQSIGGPNGLPNTIGMPGSVGPSTGPAPSAARSTVPIAPERSFESALHEALVEPKAVRFSRHAEERIRTRGIALSPADLTRLGQAMDEAASRGAKDSLVLSGSLAYVVNVPSRTVVTALYGGETRGHVFTNIDSAVVI